MDKNTFEQERQKHKIKTERLMLESELVKQLNNVIKRLNDEVDVLNNKNKNLTEAVSMLESKLKENDSDKKRAIVDALDARYNAQIAEAEATIKI